MIFFPLFLFLRRRPFRSGQESIAPLLGATTCVAYFVFCLTELVMDLSLTASIYAVLIFYLIASSEGAPLSTPDAERRAAHAAGDHSAPDGHQGKTSAARQGGASRCFVRAVGRV